MKIERILVISDVHGCLKEFKQLLNKVQLSKQDTLILLGDYIDRGPNPMDTLFYIMELINKKYKVIVLRGNHEEMFVSNIEKINKKDYKEISEDSLLNINGSIRTINEFIDLSITKQSSIINFIHNMPLYYGIENKYIFSHAGLYVPDNYSDYTLNKLLQMQTKEELLWSRKYIFSKQFKNNEYTIIFGHTPTQNLTTNKSKQGKIWYGEDKICIDCGCTFKEQDSSLACLDLTNNIEYYANFVKDNTGNI